MANQIARNLAVEGEAIAAEATANHIRIYWDPRMKAALLASHEAQLCPIARGAVELLRTDMPG